MLSSHRTKAQLSFVMQKFCYKFLQLILEGIKIKFQTLSAELHGLRQLKARQVCLQEEALFTTFLTHLHNEDISRPASQRVSTFCHVTGATCLKQIVLHTRRKYMDSSESSFQNGNQEDEIILRPCLDILKFLGKFLIDGNHQQLGSFIFFIQVRPILLQSHIGYGGRSLFYNAYIRPRIALFSSSVVLKI